MLSRRDLIATVPAVAAGATLPAAAAVSGQGGGEEATVAMLAMTLYPHPKLGAAYYGAVAQAWLGGLDAGMKGGLTAFLAALDGGMPGRWLASTDAQRREAIAANAKHPFFGAILWFLPEQIYRDPKVWALIGFDGSAIERGGWLGPDFGKLDWLPA